MRLVAEGNFVVSYFKSSGTHLGDFHGYTATGRKVSIDEIAIYQLENGKIAEQWELPDIHGMNVHLSVLNYCCGQLTLDTQQVFLYIS